MWRHRYSNQWIWHVQWTGTPELLNIRRGSALTKWSGEKKKKKKPTPPPSPSLFIGTEELKGLTSGASAHSSKARKIRRAYPTFFSLFSYSLRPFFFSSSTNWSGALLLALRDAWDPPKGNFFFFFCGEASVSGRPGRSNACRSCGERQCASTRIHAHPRSLE